MRYVIAAGLTIKTARLAAGLSQSELAQRIGTTQSAVARLESSGSNPRITTFQRALAATGNGVRLSLEPSGWPSVDETMIVENRRRSPADRLRHFEAAYDNIRELAPTRRKRRGS